VRGRLLHRLSPQEGMTLVEVLIGAVLAALVVSAIAMGMASNSDSALATQRQAQLIAVLQNRMENIRQLFTENYAASGFSSLALSENPKKGEDASLPKSPADPNDFITPYVSGYNTATSGTTEGFLIEKNYNATSEGTIDGGSTLTETLQVDTTNGRIAPVTYVDLSTGTSYSSAASVPSGHTYAIVNTYITLSKVMTSTSSTSCSTTAGTGSNASDARRVTIAARLSSATAHTNLGSRTPQYASTLLTNPIPANQCQAAAGPRIGREIK
jgi:type II secretory pathway pseudopilin PulG